jgi:hypothetical protein
VRDLVMSALGLVIAMLLAVMVYQNYQRLHRPLLTTTHQAVTLLNGDVLYGRIDHLGTDHPVLRDAFAVHEQRIAPTGEMKLVLVKRSGTSTGADHIIFQASAIAFVEPVRADSAIGQLIKERGHPR